MMMVSGIVLGTLAYVLARKWSNWDFQYNDISSTSNSINRKFIDTKLVNIINLYLSILSIQQFHVILFSCIVGLLTVLYYWLRTLKEIRTPRYILQIKLRNKIVSLKLQRSSREYRDRYLASGCLGPTLRRKKGTARHLLMKSIVADRADCTKGQQRSEDKPPLDGAMTAPNWQNESLDGFETLNAETTSINLDPEITRLCSEVDFLALHRTSSMILGSLSAKNKYDSIAQEWKRLSPLTSARNIFFNTTENALHPGCIFLSKSLHKNTPIVLDTGASVSLTPFRDDFVSFSPCNLEITGIGATSPVRGKGIVRWQVYDPNNLCTTIETEAMYMPEANIRLYSPQKHFIEQKGGSLYLDRHKVEINFPRSNKRFSIPYHHASNLPLILLADNNEDRAMYSDTRGVGAQCQLSGILGIENNNSFLADIVPSETNSRDLLDSVCDERNVNMTGPQHELLAWHYRLGHISMWTLQQLLRPKHWSKPQDETLPKTVIVETNFNSTHKCVIPQCAACNLAKRERTSIDSHKTLPSSDGSIKDGHLERGDCVSMDQIVCYEKGRSLSSAKATITGGTIFVDHATGRIKFVPQASADAATTLRGKHALEREADDLGFKIRSYVSDGGIFTSTAFRLDLQNRRQRLHLSGVGAKHQNGVAENAVKTVSNLARAMLIHAALRWPASHDLTLWPLCLEHAVYVWNHVPSRSDSLSPEEKWTGTKSDHHELRRLHPWGCPAYVLEPTLQDGKKLPKWKPKSRQGKFLGISPSHASNVALVLNRKTTRISAQFHILFDDFFTTVKGIEMADSPDLDRFNWPDFIATHGTEKYFDEMEDSQIRDTWDNVPTAPQPQREKVSLEDSGSTVAPSKNAMPDTCLPSEPQGESDEPITDPPTTVDTDDDSLGEFFPPTTEDSETLPTRSGRVPKVNRRYFNEDFVNMADADNESTLRCHRSLAEAEFYLKRKIDGYERDANFVNCVDWSSNLSLLAEEACRNTTFKQELDAFMDLQYDEDLELMRNLHPLAFAAKASSNDTPSWNEALHGEHTNGFWKAMLKEISTLNALKAWTLTPRLPHMKVLPSTWAFRIKRFPTGLVKKLKARICVMGNRQTDVDPFECYAPVVSWSTVRSMLMLSVLLGLESVQVDYTSAFCQASVKEDIYVSQPRGWKTLNLMGLAEPFKDGHVLKLNRSLYGLRQSPRNFFEHLKERLESIGFEQSKCDPCLFLKGEITCLVYVDDCLFFGRSRNVLDKAIADLKDAEMDLNIEDDVAGFLGVLLHKNEDGTVTLTQTGLIDRILSVLGLVSANGTKTPAPKPALPRDVDGEPFVEDYNYASVVGMMMYLACNSRPDIAFAVHQCARHTHKPTALHAKYLKQIGRYLRHTRDKGMIIKPIMDNTLHLECFADADFAGLYGREDGQDPHCVRSRTGYLIMVNKCPILWKSQLQTEIAWSTMEAEYVALSSACRDVIPMRALLLELGTVYGLGAEDRPSILTTIYEDNEGALQLANMELPRMTPRSKHYAAKYHWFREHVKEGLIKVVGINTKEQLADIFTKGLTGESFTSLRKKLVGW